MENIIAFLNPETLLPIGMNVLKALVVLIVGLWIAKKVKQLIIKLGQKSPQLDDTLFKFLGSIARYIIMAFVFIAVLGMFGVETTSIVAIMGAASLAVGVILSRSPAFSVMSKKSNCSQRSCKPLTINRSSSRTVKFGARRSSITATTRFVASI